MSVLARMVAYLRGHAGLSAYVGTRIYFKRLPDKPTYPSIVYQRISEVRAYTQDGPDGLPAMRVQFIVWDTDAAQVVDVANALVAALERMNLGGATTIELVMDRPEDVKTPQGLRVEGIQVDAMVPYRE